MNKVELLGRLTKDIEIRKGKKSNVGIFTLAVKRPYSKEQKEDTDFIDCVVFGKLLDIMTKYTNKGMQIVVCGSIQNSSYTDKDGNNRIKTTINVSDFYFTEFKTKKEDEQNDEVVNDLPFLE